MIVPVSHPAAVSHVPAGSRSRRVSLARLTTEAEIRTLRRDEVRRVDLELTNLDKPTYVRSADALWERILGSRFPKLGVSAERLAGYLSDPGALDVALHAYFWRTPVLAAGGSVAKGLETRHARGWDVDVDASRSVERDDRAAAPSALRAWLDGHVRILDGEAYVRRFPLATHERSPRPPGVWNGLACRISLRDAEVVAAPDSYPALASGWLGDGEPPREVRAWLDLDLGHVLAGGERRQAIDGIPEIARRRLESWMRRHPGEELPEGVGARLREAEIDALTGLGGLGDHAEALRRLDGILAVLAGLDGTGPGDPVRVQFDAVRRLYRPSLPVPSIEPEDAAALSALT